MKRKTEIAKELGLTRPTLDKYLELPGAPQPDQHHRYDLAAVTAFIKDNAASVKTSARTSPELTALRVRELTAKCEKLEFHLALEKGDFLPKARTLAEITRMGTQKKYFLRQKLERELPPKLIGLDVHQIIEVMEKTVNEICGTLHDPSFYRATYLPCEKCGHTAEAQ